MKASDEEMAFLRQIWERINDCAPRLVYADWLEERGQTWEAGAIRYFCSLKEPERMFLWQHAVAYRTHGRKEMSKELVFGAMNEHFLALHGHRYKWLRRLARYARRWSAELEDEE